MDNSLSKARLEDAHSERNDEVDGEIEGGSDFTGVTVESWTSFNRWQRFPRCWGRDEPWPGCTQWTTWPAWPGLNRSASRPFSDQGTLSWTSAVGRLPLSIILVVFWSGQGRRWLTWQGGDFLEMLRLLLPLLCASLLCFSFAPLFRAVLLRFSFVLRSDAFLSLNKTLFFLLNVKSLPTQIVGLDTNLGFISHASSM